MHGLSLCLLVDVSGLHEPNDVFLRVLLIARILAACQKVMGGLVWRYKLVNLSVAPSAFEAALHDSCKEAVAGLNMHMKLLFEMAFGVPCWIVTLV